MRPEDRADRPLEGVETVASATECTGLMPALPADDASGVNSASLYAIHDAKGMRGKRFRRK